MHVGMHNQMRRCSVKEIIKSNELKDAVVQIVQSAKSRRAALAAVAIKMLRLAPRLRRPCAAAAAIAIAHISSAAAALLL